MVVRLAIRSHAQECMVDIATEVAQAVQATGVCEGTLALRLRKRRSAAPGPLAGALSS